MISYAYLTFSCKWFLRRTSISWQDRSKLRWHWRWKATTISSSELLIEVSILRRCFWLRAIAWLKCSETLEISPPSLPSLAPVLNFENTTSLSLVRTSDFGFVCRVFFILHYVQTTSTWLSTQVRSDQTWWSSTLLLLSRYILVKLSCVLLLIIPTCTVHKYSPTD